MKKNYYITTTLPYVNDAPHIGFALEIIQADALARFKRMIGYKVIFNTGTDEHGVKIYEKALEQKKDPLKYCDEYAKKFADLKNILNLSYTNFIRTTNPSHEKAAQEFWKRCHKNGDIYKKFYLIKYCKGCELEKTDSELVNGRCPLHPKTPIETYEEENYFFRLSKHQKRLLKFYNANKKFVVPKHRFNEIINFAKIGLNDFSISRLKSKMPWGIPVPNDQSHVMYVWFDALTNYISTLGWPKNQKNFKKFWPAVQVAGKDNLRQQSAMWQGMLISAGLPFSKQIFIHGFITVEGQKMSKSLGNVVNPYEIIKKYGIDALRYYLLREISAYGDGDYSEKTMKKLYDSELANELGNLVSRLTTLGDTDNLSVGIKKTNKEIFNKKFCDYFNAFNFPLAVNCIWDDIRKLNKDISVFEPWKKTAKQRKTFLIESLKKLNLVGSQLLPIIPSAAKKIISLTSGKVKKHPPLFPRLILVK